MNKKKSLIFSSVLLIFLAISGLWVLKLYNENSKLLKINKQLIERMREKKYIKRKENSKKEGDFISDFVIRTIDDNDIDTRKLNRPILFLFFNTTCKSCIKPIIEIYRDINCYEKSGLLIIGIAMENVEILKEFRVTHDIKFPIIQDLNSKFHKVFGIIGEPSYALIDKEKRIVSIVNYFDYKEISKSLSKLIENLLEWTIKEDENYSEVNYKKVKK
ncbi:MAG: TlpA family protein disulfide reductase [Candidatus Aminicenantes bacterium]|nr:TlpA family protein disulfide reductase [Candidatus Aminicenantes bacterium]